MKTIRPQGTLLRVRNTLTASQSWRRCLGFQPPPQKKILAIDLCMLLIPIQIIPVRSSRFLGMGKAFHRNVGFCPTPVGLCPRGLLSDGLLSSGHCRTIRMSGYRINKTGYKITLQVEHSNTLFSLPYSF